MIDVAQAARLVDDSIARGTSTPSLSEHRERYVREQAEQLREALIEPISARVRNRVYDYGDLGLGEYEGAVAIARRGENWLLVMPAHGTFALAWGKEASALNALGFVSDDALAEWIG